MQQQLAHWTSSIHQSRLNHVPTFISNQLRIRVFCQWTIVMADKVKTEMVKEGKAVFYDSVPYY